MRTPTPLGHRAVSGLIKSVQRGTITIGIAAAAGTLSINAVVPENTRVRLLGITTDASGEDIDETRYARVYVNSTTTIGATLDDFGGASYTTVSVEITEYWPGVIRVQRDTVTNTGGAASGTKTIQAVNMSRTEVESLGYVCTGAVSNTAVSIRAVTGHLRLTDATTITLTVDPTSPQEMIHGFQVTETLI